MKSIKRFLQFLSFSTDKRKPLSKRVELDSEVYDTLNGCRFSIRIGTPQDVLPMVEVEKQCYNGKPPWNASSLFQDMHNNRNALYLIANHQSSTVGFIGVWFTGKEAHITNVAVIPAFQGKGLATFLIDQIRKIACQEKKETVTLEVRVSNEQAKRLYRHIGFIPGKIKKGYYLPDHEDALEMSLRVEEK